MFVSEEFEALVTTVMNNARDLFETSESQSLVAMGRIMQLQLLLDHP